MYDAMTPRTLLAATFLALAVSASGADLRIGMVGLDTSHVSVFSKIFNDPANKDHVPGGRVVAAFKGGSKDIETSWSRVEGFTKELQDKYQVKIYSSIEELCQNVDVVMIESVDGRPHLEQARIVFKSGKRVFIDKPLAGSLRDALEIRRLAQAAKVPVFSSSSLRFYPSLVELKNSKFGDLMGAISTGPCSLEEHHPDLYWYGVHPTEALFAVMGMGVETVSRVHTENTDVVVGVWAGGKVGEVRGIRKPGAAPYRVTIFGTKAVVDQKSGGGSVYASMAQQMMKFFQTGVSPVSLDETVEIMAFMEAADESKRQGGRAVKIADVLKKNGG
jgi:predicted dehydrogenase